MIRQAHRFGRHDADLPYHFGRVCGRQQTDAVGHEGRGQANRKVISIRAVVEHRGLRRDQRCELLNVRCELPCGDRLADAIRNRRVR